jgi:hypothetical protein
MRTLIVVLLTLLITVVSWDFVLPRLPPPTMPVSAPAPAPVIVHSQGPTIERLERLSHLVVTRVYVADVLVGEGEGCRGAWLIKGDALVGVNLGRARIAEKDEATKEALIVLPPPEVMQPRVDHQRSKTWEVRRETWLPWNADQDRLRDEVMLQAQQLVARAAGSNENLQQARTAAATIVKGFFEEVGWEVKVVWEEASLAKTADKTRRTTDSLPGL